FIGGKPPAASTFQATEKVDWFGTVRGRLGWLATDNFLLYGTGSLAYGRVNTSATLVSAASLGVFIPKKPSAFSVSPVHLALWATRRRHSPDTLRVAASPMRFRPM